MIKDVSNRINRLLENETNIFTALKIEHDAVTKKIATMIEAKNNGEVRAIENVRG